MINSFMDYNKHYSLLIERAKHRTTNGYTERHHIVPRCLGGTDDKDNLVDLYPEEHFLAHQLLVKIYPNNFKLINAAVMMCVNSSSQKRMNNKLYSWLRKRLSETMKNSQSGKGNSQFGTCWVSNLETKESKKIDKNLLDEYLSEGWIKKRIINWNDCITKKDCPICGKEFLSKRNTCSLSCGQKLFNKVNPKDFGKGKLDSIIEDYKKGYSIYRCLKNAGLDGTGQNHTKLKEILKNL
jgi:hypothetical protein